MDRTENHLELEDKDDREQIGDDEPALGSLDRLMDQVRAWSGGRSDIDCELDDCDSEDDDPDENKQQRKWGGGV